MLDNLRKYFGPSTLIAAAFIGPGTVTVCTLAGAEYGYQLLWALLFSTVATIFLQEMSLRIGIVTQEGLGEAIRKHTPPGCMNVFLVLLVFSAIIVGNAAYEAGNISGAVLGLNVFYEFNWWPLVIGLVAASLLWSNKYKLIENLLISLVIIMSICFMITAFALKPNLTEILKGFIPDFNGLNFIIIMALIGTTVVPYNLFLHASTISKKYHDAQQLKQARKENAVSIGLGGLISMLILIVSSTALSGKNIEISNAQDMALQLEPLLGSYASYLFGIGMLAAGMSSAITAPLAAAFTAKGIFNIGSEKDSRFILCWSIILLIGISFSLFNIKLISIITFAQIANGLILPIISLFLLYLSNKSELMKGYKNSMVLNMINLGVIAVCLLLSYKTFIQIFFS